MLRATPARRQPPTAGLAAVLGPLPAEILAAIWRLGRATTREIYEQLEQPPQHAYTTVRAAMRQLAADGYLSCLPQKKRNALVYIPCIGQEALTRHVLHQILDGLKVDYPDAVAAYIARHDQARAPRLRLVWSAGRRYDDAG